MPLNFVPITRSQQNNYLEVLAHCPQLTSDYSFINLWGWAEVYGLFWAWTDDLVWIKQTIPDEAFWAPVGSWAEINWNRYFSEHFENRTTFLRIPENLLQIWEDRIGGQLITEESRNHWDYLYAVHELVELKGKRFHKKKNLLNQFKKKYDFRFAPFNIKMIDTVLAMQQDWCTWRDCESSEALSAENVVISKILHGWNTLKGLMGGVIVVDQKIVAYTFAERLLDDTLLIHFEKGDADYKGIYQAINQMFLEHIGKHVKIVNREQDLGDTGLRKAKLSYHPVGFLKKYRATLK